MLLDQPSSSRRAPRVEPAWSDNRQEYTTPIECGGNALREFDARQQVVDVPKNLFGAKSIYQPFVQTSDVTW